MAILDQRHEVGPSTLVPTVNGGPATAEVVTLGPSDAAAHFADYRVLRDAAANLSPFEGPAVDTLRDDVGTWLTNRLAREACGPQPDAAAAAYDRMGELFRNLRQQTGFPVRTFEVDASEELVTAARVRGREAVDGQPGTEFPALGADPVRALPILRYVPEGRRQELLAGLPEPIANLAPPETNRPEGFWARARALGARALEHLPFRRRTRALGNTAVAAEVAQVAGPAAEPVVALAETTPIHERLVEVPGVGTLKYVSYFDHPDHDGLTARIDAGQRRQYVDHRIWEEDAEGALARGPFVEIMALVDPETNEPAVSMRKVHTVGGDVSQLPSVIKFNEANAFNEGGVREFQDVAQGRPTVEIASLWKDRKFDISTTVAMYREALHDSIQRGEVWIMGVVAPELRLLTNAYGTEVVRVISEPIAVNDGSATSKVRLRAAYMDPATYFDRMMDEISAEKGSPDLAQRKIGYQRETLLWRFLSGLDRKYLKPSTLDRLRAI